MIDKHAIVIGGSIAGLMTARVLSERFARVTILERDRLPNGPEERAGTPQGKHVHNLLVRGLRIMEDLFPGFDDELAAAGAPMMNYGRDVRLLVSFHQWMPNVETDFASRAASRTGGRRCAAFHPARSSVLGAVRLRHSQAAATRARCPATPPTGIRPWHSPG